MSAATVADLNGVAASWASGMVRASWHGGVALLLAWIICRAWITIPTTLRCWVWRLAYLKLLIGLFWMPVVELPLLPASSPVSRAALAGVTAPATRPMDEPVALLHPDESTTVGASSLAEPNAALGLMLVWVLGLAGCAWRFQRDRCEVRRLLASSEPVEEQSVLAALTRLCQGIQFRRLPRLLVAAGGGSPLLVGLRRPAIVVPASLLDGCTTGEIALMLAHELGHLQRRDLAWNCLPSLAQALFWFHPLVWLWGPEWRLSQELGCDETAVRLTEASAADYGALLARVAAQRRPVPISGGFGVGVMESYHTLKWRLLAMRTWNEDRRQHWAKTAAVAAVLVALGLMPWRVVALTTKNSSPGRPSPSLAEPLAMRRLSRLGQALIMYAQDWDACMPPLQDLSGAKKALLPYLRKDETVFDDPLTGQPYQPNARAAGRRIPMYISRDGQVVPLSPYRHLPYGRMQRVNRRSVDIREPWRVAAFYSASKGLWHTRGVLFLDGHFSLVSETSTDWPRIQRDSGIPASDARPEMTPAGGGAANDFDRPAQGQH